MYDVHFDESGLDHFASVAAVLAAVVRAGLLDDQAGGGRGGSLVGDHADAASRRRVVDGLCEKVEFATKVCLKC